MATFARTDARPLTGLTASPTPFVQTLPSTHEEFQSVKRAFLDGWPRELRASIHVQAIHQIRNPVLELNYQQFARINPCLNTQEYTGWHGTSALCYHGNCMSRQCNICQIVQNGFQKERARQNTTSYSCWGAATYFANQSFVCHTYNGGSELNNEPMTRCTIMAKIRRGHTVDQTVITAPENDGQWQDWKYRGYDSLRFTRDYYVAPVDYILLYNNSAAVPTHIVVYSTRAHHIKIRSELGEYCLFHNEYHLCEGGCDGHRSQRCLGQE